MRAAWYERCGPAAEVLRLGEIDRPTPAAGEVRVRMAWAGVNPSDVKRRAGWNGQSMSHPRVVPGNDGAGVVDAVGDGVDTSRIGERVWLHSTGWKRPLGTSAAFTVTPSHRAARLPDSVPLQVGAALGVPALTAHRAVFGHGPVTGRTVLVTGAAGAVGLYAVQLARWGGARVLGTVSSPGKAEIARAAGAEVVIDYRREPVVERVMQATDGRGVDHVVEVDFGANLPVTQAVIAPNGSISTYASMGAPQPALPFYALMTRNVRLLWVFVYELPTDALRQGQADVFRWLSQPDVHHPSFVEFTLDEVVAAHEAVERATVGKVMLRIGDDR